MKSASGYPHGGGHMWMKSLRSSLLPQTHWATVWHLWPCTPPHLSLKGYTIFQDSQHGYQSIPVTRGEVSARLFSNRRVCWSGGWAEESMAPFQRGQTDGQMVKPITRASPLSAPPPPARGPAMERPEGEGPSRAARQCQPFVFISGFDLPAGCATDTVISLRVCSPCLEKRLVCPLIPEVLLPASTRCLGYSEAGFIILHSNRQCAQTPTIQVTIGVLPLPESWPHCCLSQPISGTQ